MRATGVVVPKMAMVGKKHPALHRRADAVTDADLPEMRRLLPRIVATMPENGYAIALPQVGISKAAVVLADGTMWFNPELTPVGDEKITMGEGCLSIPGRWFSIERHAAVQVIARKFSDGPTQAVEVWLTETPLEARIWQHECDHLAGRLISELGPELYDF